MVGATFATVVTNMNSNIEFEKGHELVFRINAKDDDGNPDKDYEFTTDEAVKETAKIMETRLGKANISRYKVETQGYDTIKVTFVQDTDQQYSIIQNYLSFNATLALSNSKDKYALATEFLDPNKKAYMETTDGYPAIIIPIQKDNELFQAVYTEAKEMSDNNEGEVVEPHEHEEGEEEEEETVTHAYMYLWYDYIVDYYTFDKIDSNSPDTKDDTIASKVLMTFDAANPFLDDDQDALRAYVSPNNEEGEDVTADALKEAYENARYYVNLLNAGEMSYHVEFMFSKRADYFVESLIALDSHETINFQARTFIATICAIVVLSLLLVYFYKLGASSVAVTSIVSTFLGFLFVVLMGAEFNIAGLVGLIALALTSVTSGVIYCHKLKEECYRGRTLKKANAEAAKKALLPTIDLHVILIAMGVACYLLGGVIMKSFAVTAILGGLASLLLNLLGLRGLMWLVTNEQGLAGRYDLFDVSEDQVANQLEEDKGERYEGANANKDFTKAKKPVSLGALVLFVASLVCILVFGIAGKGAIYASDNPNGRSQLYVEYTSEVANNTILTADVKSVIDDIINKSTLDGQELKGNVEVETYTYVMKYDSTPAGKRPVYYAYYRIDFQKTLSGNEQLAYDGKAPVAIDEFFKDEGLSDAGIALPNNTNLSLKHSVRTNADQPNAALIIAATSVGIGISALYLLLRYRLSRGLATLVIATGATGISAGLFSMLHFLPVTSYVAVAIPFVAIFTLAIGVIFMNKEREMVLEDRSKDNSFDNRNALMVKATALSSTPITVAFIMALYLGVNFFGFMFDSVSWIFLSVILGVCVATAMTLILFGPCAQLFFKLFSGVKILKPREKKKKKARPVRVKKSAEPEEAIFIGIND